MKVYFLLVLFMPTWREAWRYRLICVLVLVIEFIDWKRLTFMQGLHAFVLCHLSRPSLTACLHCYHEIWWYDVSILCFLLLLCYQSYIQSFFHVCHICLCKYRQKNLQKNNTRIIIILENWQKTTIVIILQFKIKLKISNMNFHLTHLYAIWMQTHTVKRDFGMS